MHRGTNILTCTPHSNYHIYVQPQLSENKTVTSNIIIRYSTNHNQYQFLSSVLSAVHTLQSTVSTNVYFHKLLTKYKVSSQLLLYS